MRYRMRWLLAPFLALLLFNTPANAQSVPEPDIWFNPHSPVDILNMWTDDAPWQTAASKVKVLVLVDWWIRQVATTAQVTQIVQFAARHHMKLDLDVEPVATFPTDNCGYGEGYATQGQVASAVQILASVGARLDWIAMDEPVYFGSYATDPSKCQLPITEVVRRTALIMTEALAVYPHVRIMEIEPLGIAETPTWRADETAFHIGMSQQLGTAVQIMQADVQWNSTGWQQQILDWHSYLRERNLGFGLIFNGSDQAASDADWINTAVNNIEVVEGQLHVIPDEVLFTTWNAYPRYNMPETSPTALTWLINRYVRPRSELQEQF